MGFGQARLVMNSGKLREGYPFMTLAAGTVHLGDAQVHVPKWKAHYWRQPLGIVGRVLDEKVVVGLNTL